MRAIVLLSFFVYLFVLVILQQIIGISRGSSNPPRAEYPRFTLFRCISLALMPFALQTMKNESFTTFYPIRIAGIIIVVLGLVLSMWAQYKLGKYWAGGIGLHKDHKLVTTGPYKYVRHPLYAGMLMSAFGICLISLNILYGLSACIFCGAYALRGVHEDAMLSKKFKKRFDSYAATTGAIFPRFRKGG